MSNGVGSETGGIDGPGGLILLVIIVAVIVVWRFY